jgi:hypothetical protein
VAQSKDGSSASRVSDAAKALRRAKLEAIRAELYEVRIAHVDQCLLDQPMKLSNSPTIALSPNERIGKLGDRVPAREEDWPGTGRCECGRTRAGPNT